MGELLYSRPEAPVQFPTPQTTLTMAQIDLRSIFLNWKERLSETCCVLASVLRHRGLWLTRCSLVRHDQSSAGPQLFIILIKMCYHILALGSLTEIQLRGNGHDRVRNPRGFLCTLRGPHTSCFVEGGDTYIICDLLHGDDTLPTLEWHLAHRGIKASLKKPDLGRFWEV